MNQGCHLGTRYTSKEIVIGNMKLMGCMCGDGVEGLGGAGNERFDSECIETIFCVSNMFVPS